MINISIISENNSKIIELQSLSDTSYNLSSSSNTFSNIPYDNYLLKIGTNISIDLNSFLVNLNPDTSNLQWFIVSGCILFFIFTLLRFVKKI